MEAQTKVCQNCKQDFTIEPEDFDFYEKIKVPPPTFCPECRLQRKLVFRNERVFYRRKCDLCNKEIVSRYDARVSFPVYCPVCWWSDKWDPLTYGRPYDFSKPFFVQYRELAKKVPRPALAVTNAVNSDYANQCLDVKNVYLSTSVIRGEEIYYSVRIDDSRDIFDVSYGQRIERCAHSIDLVSDANIAYGRYVKNSFDSRLLYDVRNSSHCFACANVRNGKYRIFNAQYEKGAYETEISKCDLGSYANLVDLEARFGSFALKFPRRYAMLDKCVNVIGNNVQNAKNCYAVFDSFNLENCKYMLAVVDGAKDSYDLAYSGIGAELCYESSSCIGSRNRFSYYAYGRDMEYCELTPNRAAACFFGCVGITSKKEYCIFNRQYGREEYDSLVSKIRAHMSEMPYIDAGGREYKYGEFFPIEFSTFAYNETVAQEYFPLTKEKAEQRGYRWKDREERRYRITMTADRLPDHINDVPETITKETIQCRHAGSCDDNCTGAFLILPQELAFYRAMRLALPRLCPNCRYYQRLKQRNPLKLWHRQCQCARQGSNNGVYKNTISHQHGNSPCPNEFETSYATDRPEIIYCEQCYNAEIV